MSVKKNRIGLLGVIADEDTCAGFAIAGVGELTKKLESNIFVLYDTTSPEEVETWLRELVQRRDVLIIVICRAAADMTRKYIESLQDVLPQIIEIPSRYDSDYRIEVMSSNKRIQNIDLTEVETRFTGTTDLTTALTTDSLPSISSEEEKYNLSISDHVNVSFRERRKSTSLYLSDAGLQRLEDVRRKSTTADFYPEATSSLVSIVSRRSSITSDTSERSGSRRKRGKILKFKDILGSQFENTISANRRSSKDNIQNNDEQEEPPKKEDKKKKEKAEKHEKKGKKHQREQSRQ